MNAKKSKILKEVYWKTKYFLKDVSFSTLLIKLHF